MLSRESTRKFGVRRQSNAATALYVRQTEGSSEQSMLVVGKIAVQARRAGIQ
jgi:hypothetical protein